MQSITGLHHVTAIAGPAQENLDFYAGVLGMRLVKKSVNQDDPGTYHLFYADAEGRPGHRPHLLPLGAHGAGATRPRSRARRSALAVPPGSLDFWGARLERYGARLGAHRERASATARCRSTIRTAWRSRWSRARARRARPFTPWEQSPVPAGTQIRGLDGARALGARLGPTEACSSSTCSASRRTRRGGGLDSAWASTAAARARALDLARDARRSPRGAWGTGAVHHLAWRVADEAHQLALRAARSPASGIRPR